MVLAPAGFDQVVPRKDELNFADWWTKARQWFTASKKGFQERCHFGSLDLMETKKQVCLGWRSSVGSK